jgi:hypothetical protein
MKLGAFGKVAVSLAVVLLYEHMAKLNGLMRLAPLIESASMCARDSFIYLGAQLALSSSWVIYLRIGDMLSTTWELLDPLFRLLFSFLAFLDGYSKESLKLAHPLSIVLGTLLTVAFLNWTWMKVTGKPSLFDLLAAHCIKLGRLLKKVIFGDPNGRQLRTFVVSGGKEQTSSSDEFEDELGQSSEEEIANESDSSESDVDAETQIKLVAVPPDRAQQVDEPLRPYPIRTAYSRRVDGVQTRRRTRQSISVVELPTQ